ncbi:MAG: DUF3332 family protein [Kiritimatiellia bacterium]
MKKIVYGAAAVLALLATGCTGSFKLMQGINKWHTGFESRWTDEVCYLIPGLFLYSAAWCVDTVAFNSMEFWLGESPITLQAGNLTITRMDARTALVRNNETNSTFTLVRNADGTLSMSDAQGNSVKAELRGSLLTMTASDGTFRTALVK